MGARYIAVSAASTVLSFVFIQFWTELSLDNLKSDGLIAEKYIHSENASLVIELLSGSYATIGLLTNFVLNVFALLVLFLKGTFLPLVIPPTVIHAGLWSFWLTVLCSLKMFQALARDQLERLNASPSATPWTYFSCIFSLIVGPHC